MSVEEIAEAAGTDVCQVEQAVDAARCERDQQGRLIDLHGLTLTPTIHRLTIDGKILFSCCALWTELRQVTERFHQAIWSTIET